ncbi:MAG: hypothetical protein AABX29_07260 [Nanoarchaeota archaeon]
MKSLKKASNIFKKGIIGIGNLESFSHLTNLKCPKCNSKLYEIFLAEGGYPQNYVCRKCNYTGSLGLKIDKRRIK